MLHGPHALSYNMDWGYLQSMDEKTEAQETNEFAEGYAFNNNNKLLSQFRGWTWEPRPPEFVSQLCHLILRKSINFSVARFLHL